MIQALKKQLAAEYRYRIELHAHSKPVSVCSEVTPAELVEIYRRKGFDGMVLTNHFVPSNKTKEEVLSAYRADYEATKAAGDAVGMRVYYGAEIRFCENSNDYLIYGVDDEILAQCYAYLPKGVAAFRHEVSLPHSVFLQAHPCRDNVTLCDPTLLDGVETFNMHPGHNSRVGLACRFAEENGLAIRTAGSDFHHPNKGHEGVSALRVKEMPADGFALAELLRSGDYLFEIGEGALAFL